ncbi:polysaccharide biosynthesis/export family protein [Geomonas oryzae]|uniref:polysaccharide biosynthesis/export family protein n=1 Tax=Geomonas oryzae TaxID=2364273 RepID=UPI001FEA174A|nr:polysaccharide biosynthesis/export family protein [Geomonas oryzae]
MLETVSSVMLKIVSLAVTAVLCLGVSCAQAAPPAALPTTVGEYLVGPGDILGIEVWKDPSLTRTVVVLADGKIVFPLIGEVAAGGKSVAALRSELAERISIYVPETNLTLEVKQVNSLFVYVLGRVNNPGRLQLNGNVNVLQALAMAGGLNPYAKRGSIKIFREEDGATRIIPFDYDDVTSGARLQDNITLKRSDVLFVP